MKLLALIENEVADEFRLTKAIRDNKGSEYIVRLAVRTIHDVNDALARASDKHYNEDKNLEEVALEVYDAFKDACEKAWPEDDTSCDDWFNANKTEILSNIGHYI